eukprot:97371-Amphidinium_carterae.1
MSLPASGNALEYSTWGYWGVVWQHLYSRRSELQATLLPSSLKCCLNFQLLHSTAQSSPSSNSHKTQGMYTVVTEMSGPQQPLQR